MPPAGHLGPCAQLLSLHSRAHALQREKPLHQEAWHRNWRKPMRRGGDPVRPEGNKKDAKGILYLQTSQWSDCSRATSGREI